ncbi:MAG: MFS transporter [Candidatus Omnitrophota bacterium]|nr:MAG: MFS transporter [Candidatus Omnitrophota bacterium]
MFDESDTRDAMSRLLFQQNRHNFFLHLIDGVLYMCGQAFTSTEIVLSVLIYRLGGSEIAIGCVFALTELGQAIPQLISAPFMEGLPRKKMAVLIGGMTQRTPWLIIALLLLFGDVKQDGSLVPIVLMLISFTFLTGGVMGPAWSEFVASTVPLQWRGRLFALRQGIGGVFGVGVGFLVTYIVDSIAFPHNFSCLFFCTYVIWLLSLSSLIFVKENANPVRRHEVYSQYFFRDIPHLLKEDRDFRWFLMMKALMLMSLISFGFFSVYAIKRFQLPAYYAGTFTVFYMIGQIGSSFLFGYLADRYGHRVNVKLFSLIVILQSVLAIIAPSIIVFYFIFLLLGANRSVHSITFVGMPLEYGDSRNRPTFYALSNTMLAPFYLSGIIGGLLISSIGYEGLFVLSSIFALLTLVCTVLFVRDPRILGRES